MDREIEAKYEVLAIMGEGGMGAVYKVRHRYLDEVQIIKLVRETFRANEELKARFLREARTAKRLRHPNIAEVIDYSVTSEGTAFIVMEFIEGMNLREVMARAGGMLDARLVIEIGLQTLSALAYLHGKGFVHRDVSPDNLMLGTIEGSRVVKLIDLGIAKPLAATSNLTVTGQFIGKVRYASPEQFGESDLDPRSDLYSLGVVLYELSTGIAPIGGSDHRAMIAGHLTRPPRPFAETDPHGRVPASLRAVILRALQKAPDDRYPTAEAFAEALRGTLAEDRDAPVATVEIPATEPVAIPAGLATTTHQELPLPGAATEVSRRAFPRRSSAVAAIVMFVLLAAAAAFVMTRQRPAVDATDAPIPEVHTAQPAMQTAQPVVQTAQPVAQTAQPASATAAAPGDTLLAAKLETAQTTQAPVVKEEPAVDRTETIRKEAADPPPPLVRVESKPAEIASTAETTTIDAPPSEQKDCDYTTTNKNGFRVRHHHRVTNYQGCKVTYTIANVTKTTLGDTKFEADTLAYTGDIPRGETVDVGYLSFTTEKCRTGEAESSIDVVTRGWCGTDKNTYQFHTIICTNCTTQR